MVDKDEKYYDPINLYPKLNFKRNNGTTSVLKTIRVPPEELENWNVKRIHDLLKGVLESKDSTIIGKFKQMLRGLYNLMSKMDFIEDPSEEDIALITMIKEMIK